MKKVIQELSRSTDLPEASVQKILNQLGLDRVNADVLSRLGAHELHLKDIRLSVKTAKGIVAA